MGATICTQEQTMNQDVPEPADNAVPDSPSGIDPTRLRTAMKAFRKRLKLARLDDESRLGHGAMSSGGRSGIKAIQPPNRYPQEVWDELVRQGKLRRAGYGLLELADEL
jgi:hypothetical protein